MKTFAGSGIYKTSLITLAFLPSKSDLETILMPDVRSNFYSQYVSKFKKEYSVLGDKDRARYFACCEHWFLPLLKGLNPDSRILELGCGSGYMLEFLTHHGFTNVHGIDISTEMVDLAKERGNSAEVADVFE